MLRHLCSGEIKDAGEGRSVWMAAMKSSSTDLIGENQNETAATRAYFNVGTKGHPSAVLLEAMAPSPLLTFATLVCFFKEELEFPVHPVPPNT